jgi:hypothetical protein
MMTDHVVPITTTNSIAPSVCPNQSSANGTQHTLGKVCSPSAKDPTVSFSTGLALVISPNGRPMTTPSR